MEVDGDGVVVGEADVVGGAADGILCGAVPEGQAIAELLVVGY